MMLSLTLLKRKLGAEVETPQKSLKLEVQVYRS